MKLTFNELKKRDVINVVDGQCLGRVVDLTLQFPKGNLVGISVPARRKRGFLSLFDKSTLYIDEQNVLKIGSDVILVNVNCGNACAPSVNINGKPDIKPPPCPPKQVCPPKPNCPPFCPPPKSQNSGAIIEENLSIFGDYASLDNDE